MSATDPGPQPRPARRFDWLKAALVFSLAVNLLFIGGAVARFVTHGPPERVSGYSQTQLIPKKFFGELDRQRRGELLKVFRDYAPTFRSGRKTVRENALKLVEVLESEPYDPARVRAAVKSFADSSASLAGSGPRAALALIEMLTPEERRLLARHIRQRDEGMRHKGGAKRESE